MLGIIPTFWTDSDHKMKAIDWFRGLLDEMIKGCVAFEK
jgi:hypothetical protein